jgi:uncharacterized membrane protein
MVRLTPHGLNEAMTGIRIVALIAATLATGLSAGLFYGWACSVMPGLARASDRTFVEALQRINVAIINPWFMATFLGAAVLTALALVLHLPAGSRATLPWIAAGLVLFVGMLVITFTVNVPLNNQLDAAGPPDQAADLAAVRAKFEATWVRWNIARAVSATAGFASLLVALVTSR